MAMSLTRVNSWYAALPGGLLTGMAPGEAPPGPDCLSMVQKQMVASFMSLTMFESRRQAWGDNVRASPIF